MSNNTNRTKFICPHNEDVQITNKCVITECPYHMDRVKDFFTIEIDSNYATNCVYHDSDLMTNVTASRAQISALSRDNRRVLNPKVIKNMYDAYLQRIKILYTITHSLPDNSNCCKNCGYPDASPKCVSTTLCNTRMHWVNSVISLFYTDSTLIKKQLIWQILLNKELKGIEKILIENGINLCSKKHINKIVSGSTVK